MIINCPNARDKAPPEPARNLIALSVRQIHQISSSIDLFSFLLCTLHSDSSTQTLIFTTLGEAHIFFHVAHPVTVTTKVSGFVLFFSQRNCFCKREPAHKRQGLHMESTRCVTQKSTLKILCVNCFLGVFVGLKGLYFKHLC